MVDKKIVTAKRQVIGLVAIAMVVTVAIAIIAALALVRLPWHDLTAGGHWR
jgi:hypothetical protein